MIRSPKTQSTRWVLALVLSVGCGWTDSGQSGLRYGPAELSHEHLPVQELIGTVLNEDPTLGLPSEIAVNGPFLILLDLASDSAIHVIEAATGAHLAQLGRRGSGPGEFATAWSVDPVPADSSLFWIYDIELRRLTQIDVVPSVLNGRLACNSIVTLTSEAVPTGPIWLGTEMFASLGFFPEGRIGFFDADGTHTTSVGALPPAALSQQPSIRQHAYRATLVRHPSRPLMAAATRNASIVQIYRIDGKHIADVDGPLAVRPRYRLKRGRRGGSLQTGPDLRFGYVDVAAAGDRIYALFSGRTREGFPRSAFQGRFVHVFDWGGHFEMAFEVEAGLVTIALDSGAGVLYAVRHEPAPAVMRYSLGSNGAR